MIEYIIKKINKIFNWIYSKQGYYALKSGLFVDHYFKIFFHYLNKEIFLFFGLIFADFFIVNRFINNFYYYWAKCNNKLLNITKNNNLFALKITIVIIIISVLIFSFIVL